MNRYKLVLGGLVTLFALSGVLYQAWLKERGWIGGLLCRYVVCEDEAAVEAAHQRLWSGELDGAVEWFRAALRRDAASPYRWCDLGEALLEADRREEARQCFGRAVELGGHSPPVLMRAANFHFRMGEGSRALPYTARVLAMLGDYDGIVFSSYSRMGISVEEALKQGLPEEKRAAQAFFRYVLGRGSLEETERVWKWMGERSLEDFRLADEYAGFLVGARQYERAAREWAAHGGSCREGYPEWNYVFNGSFECEPAGQTLDWRITPVAGAAAGRDGSVASAGRWSLRIDFEGRENLAYRHVAQRAFVKPGAYRFEAQVRASGITTDQGVGFRIVDAEDSRWLEVTTERVAGTTDWRKVEKRFTVGKQTGLVEVQVVREPSLKFDNKIGGTVWIDGVKLGGN